MTVVRIGNPAPMMQVADVGVPAEHLSVSVTTMQMREGFDDPKVVMLALSTPNDRTLNIIARVLDEEHLPYAIGVLEVDQMLGTHMGSGGPAWVDSDDEKLAEALAAFYDCPRGEPMALLTTVGRDALHAQHLSSSQPAGFNFMAFSASTVPAVIGSTVLPGEITTSGGGLVRASASFAHTAGTNTSTLTRTGTANGSDALPVVVAKIGILNASPTGGVLGYESLLNATSTLTIPGDNVTATDTVTAG